MYWKVIGDILMIFFKKILNWKFKLNIIDEITDGMVKNINI
jgi:hypothetical protein